MEERTESRAVHDQSEQHEQRRRDRDEVSGLLGQPLIDRHQHGQYDRHRPSHAAPYKNRLVSRVDRLNQARGLADREHPKNDQSARGGGADDHGCPRRSGTPMLT